MQFIFLPWHRITIQVQDSIRLYFKELKEVMFAVGWSKIPVQWLALLVLTISQNTLLADTLSERLERHYTNRDFHAYLAEIGTELETFDEVDANTISRHIAEAHFDWIELHATVRGSFDTLWNHEDFRIPLGFLFFLSECPHRYREVRITEIPKEIRVWIEKLRENGFPPAIQAKVQELRLSYERSRPGWFTLGATGVIASAALAAQIVAELGAAGLKFLIPYFGDRAKLDELVQAILTSNDPSLLEGRFGLAAAVIGAWIVAKYGPWLMSLGLLRGIRNSKKASFLATLESEMTSGNFPDYSPEEEEGPCRITVSVAALLRKIESIRF